MSRLSRLAGRILATMPRPPRHKVHTVRFRRLIRNLRELVELSEDATDKLGGEWILDRSYVATFVSRTLDLAREIVFDSNVLAGAPSAELHARLDAVRASLGRLMAARPPAVGEEPTPGPRASVGGGETAGGAHPEEPEYRLLRAAIRLLALTGDTTPGRGSSPMGPRLAEVVREAHERALRSFEGLRCESWGRHAGRSLVGSGFPAPVRVVDVGGGTASAGESEWRPRLDWHRVRSAPLRVLLEGAHASGGTSGRGAHALAVVTEEHATVDVGWPEGILLVDAGLGEHAAANGVYCALREASSRSGEPVRAVVAREGFRRLDLGPGLTAWLQGRGPEESRRALGRLGGAVGALLREPERSYR